MRITPKMSQTNNQKQVGPAATEELQKLQDAVPPFPNDLAFQVIDEELGAGRTWQDVFTDVSPQPVAAASLAQVCGWMTG